MSAEKLSPGAAARAQRDADFAARFGNGVQPKPVVPKAAPLAQATPYAAQEASKYEARFLKNLTNARDDFEWIKANEAWKTLGHESFTSWWETRVAPIMSALSMRPSRAVASEVVDRALADDAAAPEEKRRGTGKIAQLAGVDRKTVQRRTGAAMSHPDTSAAGPAASTDGAFPPVGEPVDVGVAAASTGTQSPPAAELIEPSHAGVPAVGDQTEDLAEDEVPCFECSAPLDPRDAADGYYKCLDCDPERLFRAAPDSPAADHMAPPSPQQPGQDSPTGLEAVQPHDDRSETSRQQVAGVSPAGVAPGSGSGPEHADPVEPVDMEDGDAAVTPSSSDLDVAGNPAERLLLAVAGLVHYLDQVDVDVVGPLLFGPDVEQLFSHAEEISAHITRIGKARFAEMLHTQ